MAATIIEREKLLRALEAASCGVSPREVIVQSDHFVFDDGKVKTYNEDVACVAPTDLPETFRGAIKAKMMLDMLSKLPDEELSVSATDARLVFLGKGKRKTEFNYEKEIMLPVDDVAQPTEWLPLDGHFAEAVGVVQQCASSNMNKVQATCVHVHPDWIEAFDDMHLCRWPLKTPVTEPILVKRNSIRPVGALGMTEMAQTDKWLHFRNPQGVVIACRRYLEDFPDFNKFLDFDGEPATLPAGLGEVAERAKIMADENTEHNLVRVKLKPGRVTIIGEGVGGRYVEPKACQYAGTSLDFLIAPGLLADIVQRSTDVVVTEDRLKITAVGSYVYVSVLRKVEESTGSAE